MAVALADLLVDLVAESAELDQLVAGLAERDWEKPTPARGWAIRDQLSHLAYFDETAILAATHPDRFREEAAELLAIGAAFPDRIAEKYRNMPVVELLRWFRTARAELVRVLGSLDPRARLPWYGPDMSVASSITARMMETWAHGQDVFDALGETPGPTARLRHIAHLGVSTFGFAYQLNGREVPTVAVRVELTAPDGSLWDWGQREAQNQVAGSALDFCLVVTQRRHRSDTGLEISGPVADEWMSIAQAFAGAPSSGREPKGASR